MHKTLCAIAFSLWLAVPVQAATVAHAVTTTFTVNASTFTTASFTPAANDLIVVTATASDTVSACTMTDTQTLGMTTAVSGARSASADRFFVYVANALAAASSMTVTLDCTGDEATGAIINVALVTGVTRTGASAILQSAKQENQTAATPAPVFGAAVLTDNPVISGVFNNTNPSTVPIPSGGWALIGADAGHNSPNTGLNAARINSGFTSTTVTWGGASASAFGSAAVEIDTTAAGGAAVSTLLLLGCCA